MDLEQRCGLLQGEGFHGLFPGTRPTGHAGAVFPGEPDLAASLHQSLQDVGLDVAAFVLRDGYGFTWDLQANGGPITVAVEFTVARIKTLAQVFAEVFHQRQAPVLPSPGLLHIDVALPDGFAPLFTQQVNVLATFDGQAPRACLSGTAT